MLADASCGSASACRTSAKTRGSEELGYTRRARLTQISRPAPAFGAGQGTPLPVMAPAKRGQFAFRIGRAASAEGLDKRQTGSGMASGSRQDDDGEGGTVVVTKTRTVTKRPNLYRVLLLNDDYTPMEFVIHVVERFFQKNREEATRIMLHVHHHGVGECGVFTYEVAETKVTQVMDFARKHQHPLQCVMEKK